MSTKMYFVRSRGKVSGPYDLKKLKFLRNRGQLARFHELSEDKRTWAPAETMFELIESGLQEVTNLPAAGWHYTDRQGQQHGPVPPETIAHMWVEGAVRDSTMVWQEGMANWVRLSSRPAGLPILGPAAKSSSKWIAACVAAALLLGCALAATIWIVQKKQDEIAAAKPDGSKPGDSKAVPVPKVTTSEKDPVTTEKGPAVPDAGQSVPGKDGKEKNGPRNPPDQDAAQVTWGRHLIETERNTIFFVMHPTATLTRLDYDGVRQLKDGFILTYTFNFKGISGNRYSMMDFAFSERGRFLGLKTNDTSSFIEPFLASDAAMVFLKDMVKNDFELKKDGAIAKAIDAADSKRVLELILQYKHSRLRTPVAEPRLQGHPN